MNVLKELHTQLDQSSWDIDQRHDISDKLQEVTKILKESGDETLAHLADIENQAIMLNKLPQGLKHCMLSKYNTEDGSEQVLKWPDIDSFNEDAFKFIHERFKETSNIFLKTEYGLVLFYSKQKQDNSFIEELLTSLLELSKTYIVKAKDKNAPVYIQHLYLTLDNALSIATKRKDEQLIRPLYKKVIELVFTTHQGWDKEHEAIAQACTGLTNLASNYFNNFQEVIADLAEMDKKNCSVAQLCNKNNDPWQIMYIIDASVILARKLKVDYKRWYSYKALQYEELAEQRKGDIASISFIEEALQLYKRLKDQPNIDRLENLYQKKRDKYQLPKIREEFAPEATQAILSIIEKFVKEKDEEEIVIALFSTPHIQSLEKMKTLNQDPSMNQFLSDFFPSIIIDKFGNTIAKYQTDEELNQYKLLHNYGLSLQISIQFSVEFFLEAYRENKISAKSIIDVLKQTWVGRPKPRIVNGEEFAINYIKVIESGLCSFFNELDKAKEDDKYNPNFVCATDSLFLKSEYLIREMCIHLDIKTFKHDRNPEIILERTLDDMLNDPGFKDKITEDDHFFIKYVLTEKAGYNLRNKVAHGLMDDIEYTIQNPILAIIVLLKLANYEVDL